MPAALACSETMPWAGMSALSSAARSAAISHAFQRRIERDGLTTLETQRGRSPEDAPLASATSSWRSVTAAGAYCALASSDTPDRPPIARAGALTVASTDGAVTAPPRPASRRTSPATGVPTSVPRGRPRNDSTLRDDPRDIRRAELDTCHRGRADRRA